MEKRSDPHQDGWHVGRNYVGEEHEYNIGQVRGWTGSDLGRFTNGFRNGESIRLTIESDENAQRVRA